MADTKTIFSMHRDKTLATTTPVDSVDNLQGIWDRDFGVYRVVVVQVYELKGSLLSFDILLNPLAATVKGRKRAKRTWRASAAQYSVDLDDGLSVWGDLPSTAQLYVSGGPRIAYLCLNENWLWEHLPEGAFVGGSSVGPKIPRIESL